MALLYVPNPHNLPIINHIDGIKTNNHYTNLEWCTLSHNVKEAYRLGALCQVGEKNNASIYSDELVKSVIEGFNGENITNYARELNIPYHAVYAFLRGIREIQ